MSTVIGERCAYVAGLDLGQKRDSALCLEGLAWVAEALGYARRSAVIYGAVAALRQATGAQETPHYRANHARSVDRARERLGETAFAAAWAEGQAMPLAQAITYALGEEVEEAHGFKASQTC